MGTGCSENGYFDIKGTSPKRDCSGRKLQKSETRMTASVLKQQQRQSSKQSDKQVISAGIRNKKKRKKTKENGVARTVANERGQKIAVSRAPGPQLPVVS